MLLTDTGSINFLLIGSDKRPGGSYRTDTMVIVILWPREAQASMISIPRDLWVNIPGFDHERINTAHFLGDTYKLPGGGPALAAKTVENFLGVPVQYYAVVPFDAFTRMVDEIGCINIWAFEDLSIDPLGKGNTIHLTKDKGYCMDGATLLAYMRNRNTQGGDVDRARRTQQAILALKDAVLDPANFPTLITKAPALYREIASLREARQRMELARSADRRPVYWGSPAEDLENGLRSEEEFFTAAAETPVAVREGLAQHLSAACSSLEALDQTGRSRFGAEYPGLPVLAGVCAWTLAEYALHRFVFHELSVEALGAREHRQHHAQPD